MLLNVVKGSVLALSLCCLSLGQFAWAERVELGREQNFCQLLAVEDGSQVTFKNVELGDGKRCGWKIDLPKDWVQIPDVKPGWPLAAGWRTPEGKTGIVVTFLNSVNESEYEVLRGRRFLESEKSISEYKGKLFYQITGPNFKQILYIERPEGVYRLTAFGITKYKVKLQNIVDSFGLLSPSECKSEAVESYSNANMAISFSLPADVASLEVKELSKGIEVRKSGKKIMSVVPRSMSAENGQSFRGLCRQIGKNYISEAESLSRFEPYVLAGKNGYLAVWQKSNQEYVGPMIYVPYNRGTNNILEFKLEDPEEINLFFRLVNSVKFDN